MKGYSNAEGSPHHNQMPEKRLFAAVLQRAVADFVTATGDAKLVAKNWIFFDDNSDSAAPLQFRMICDALDLDIEDFRVAILGLEREYREKGSSAAFEAMM